MNSQDTILIKPFIAFSGIVFYGGVTMIILKEQKTQILKESPKTMSSSKVKNAAEKVFKDFSKMIEYLKDK